MSSRAIGKSVRVDVDDLVLFDESGSVGETFIFEPSAAEQNLGSMFAVAETQDKSGVGRELVETVVQALQREYYRDPARGMLASFESALHQANLVLYDLVEQGVRDWMGSFHVVVGVLAGTTLHVSTAGDAVVVLSRAKRLTSIAAGLSHSPVTDPLRTFSQVASGALASRDVLFFGTSQFEHIFKQSDLSRFLADLSASTISLRLQQLYEDRRAVAPVAVLIVSLLPKQYAPSQAQSRLQEEALANSGREPISVADRLQPRQPLIINRSTFKRVLLLIGKIFVFFWVKTRQIIWPLVKISSRKGGSALVSVSKTVGQKAAHGISSMTGRQGEQLLSPMAGVRENGPRFSSRRRISLGAVQSLPTRMWRGLTLLFSSLPKTSKVFAVVAVILAIALVTSLIFLQQKRTEDMQFQRASELLHEARTKTEAAETAMIYDNRDQARVLLKDAGVLIEQIELTGLYAEQLTELDREITTIYDRLAKVVRVAASTVTRVGDFAEAINNGTPNQLFYLLDSLYTYNPENNMIARMTQEGTVQVVSQNTQGVGFFKGGVSHAADKSLVLLTDEPGLVIYDAKNDLLQKQEINWPAGDPDILSLATFGSRLYVYDRSAKNIYGYSKTLRGYSGGTPWVTDGEFPSNTIQGIGVDGFIYTFHDDGIIRKLFQLLPQSQSPPPRPLEMPSRLPPPRAHTTLN